MRFKLPVRRHSKEKKGWELCIDGDIKSILNEEVEAQLSETDRGEGS